MIEIRRYSNTDKPIWDDFVKRSKNATFLHLRDYMDYHADRFDDFSLMAFNHHGKLAAGVAATTRAGCPPWADLRRLAHSREAFHGGDDA